MRDGWCGGGGAERQSPQSIHTHCDVCVVCICAELLQGKSIRIFIEKCDESVRAHSLVEYIRVLYTYRGTLLCH